MHELSIALSLVDLACEEASRMPEARVAALHVEIGPLAGVVKDALLFSFGIAAAGTPIEGARLEIHETPVVAWCDSCEAEQTLSHELRRRCPACDSPTPKLVRGEELSLVSLEVGDVCPNR
jgi:hydrogenase nickel incorporation protein HypA/HybF